MITPIFYHLQNPRVKKSFTIYKLSLNFFQPLGLSCDVFQYIYQITLMIHMHNFIRLTF